MRARNRPLLLSASLGISLKSEWYSAVLWPATTEQKGRRKLWARDNVFTCEANAAAHNFLQEGIGIMTRQVWIHDGRKADAASLTAILSAARADKMRRLGELRMAMQAEAADDADARALHKATKKRLREIDRELRKLDAHLRKVGAASRKASRELDRTILTYARAYGGGQIGEREIKQFDKLFHFGKPSATKADGLSSFHCKFTSRGFGERRANRSRTYKPGEAVRHLRYIIRDGAREPGVDGLVSNISQDPDQLAGFFAALEELEAHDRANANVYMSLVLSLPHELTPAAREQILRDACALFAEHDLPYAGVLHAPDPRGDQRNFHAHVMFSLRPCVIDGRGRYAFATDKSSDLNDESFIEPFRHEVADIMNAAMARENHPRRFTALSDADRGLEPRSKRSGKSSPGEKHWQRKQEELERMQQERAALLQRQAILQRLRGAVTGIAAEPGQDRRAIIADFAARARTNLTSQAAGLRAAAVRRAALLRQLTHDTHAAARTRLQPLTGRLQNAKPRARQPLAEPRAQPVPHRPRVTRDPERRRAIAAAARSLRQTPFPPIARTATGFAIARGFTSQHVDVDRFEAEAIIQRIHTRKWETTLAALKRHVEKSARSPFVAGEDRPKLDPYSLDMRLRDAYWAAYPSRDMQVLLEGLRRDWLFREEAKRREQKKVEQTKAAADAELRERADRIIARSETLVETGKWPGANNMTLAAVSMMAKAIINGQFAIRMVGSDAHIYCESEALQGIAGILEASPTGRNALVAFGKLTADRPIDRKALPLAWTLPLSRAARSTESPPEPSRPGPSRGRGSHER